MTVAYLANQFPSPVEPYVTVEIEELRRRGVRVIAGSVWRPDERARSNSAAGRDQDLVVLQPFHIALLARAAWLCLRRWRRISDLVGRVIVHGRESTGQRLKALVHTWLGAYYAVCLQEKDVQHIHVHHGYFGAWVAMVAARLLNVSYSITLHGSDLLTHAAYLDAKLNNCQFCVTVSEFNRGYILGHYPMIDPGKVVVARLGVDLPEPAAAYAAGVRASILRRPGGSPFRLLAVGRLHAVKDHAFFLRACAELCRRGLDFRCEIAGEGPERRNLERLIREYRLAEHVCLLGYVPHKQLEPLYQAADVVVVTSRSEGIPLVLMEAISRGKIVLAPAITGIPELVVAGETGFLYEPGSAEDFVARVLWLRSLTPGSQSAGSGHQVSSAVNQLDRIRNRAKEHVRRYFNRKKNLESFADLFLERALELTLEPTLDRTAANQENSAHEDPLLQQI
ncbi:MAG TPA: glycosyltransferase family 4 protein [Candidatus Sulfotelmatobacter sp.]|nr:glycosyltransferase family 4 protein [Candidatus Sulfotelmatobacter sp.]